MDLPRFARLTAAATFLLLIAGGLVTSTGSGLAVPDWPLSYGKFFPPMVGGIFFEHGHRMIAGVVAILIAILAITLRRREPRRWVRRLGYAAVLGVVMQALLGGLTVLLLLPAPISIAHACLGQTVSCLIVSIALVTSRAWDAIPSASLPDARLFARCLTLTVLLFAQLILGAIIRHAGRAVLSHIIGAGVILGMTGMLWWRLRSQPGSAGLVRRLAGTMVGLVLVQMTLGMLTLWSGQRVALATAHVAVGALLLASSCVLTWIVGASSRLLGTSKDAIAAGSLSV